MDYKAPLRDIKFAREEVLDFYNFWQTLPGCEEATPDMVDAIMEEAAKFCEQEIAPLYRVGDEQGCIRDDEGNVKTPDGFKEAYQNYVAMGWPAMAAKTEHGGQGLPKSLATVLSEMTGTANWSWQMYPGLSAGAYNTVETHGTDAQKAIYLPKLVSGEWTGTMCLTEPHCGTDLGMLRTKADPAGDGSYKISGTKIFISSGEHDMAENIVHIVLARLPDAPPGTKGISLFIVPKFVPNADGSLGERNGVVCGALEHKMGIHGNATAVLNFDEATGYLLGEPNRGLPAMFTFMNFARVGTALQGLCHSERAYQGAVPYARDRLQSRSLRGAVNKDGPADPIIVHPDVRRMLLTIKSFNEGMRLFVNYLTYWVDVITYSDDPKRVQNAEDMLSMLTPVAKGFMTEIGFECASLGMQVYGGHGYIAEWGMEQNCRDARIAMMYEGANGIQALDLLGRKILGTRGKLLKPFEDQVNELCEQLKKDRRLGEFYRPLVVLKRRLRQITRKIGFRAMKNPDEVGAASFDYMMFCGYYVLAYFWGRAVLVAQRKLDEGTEERAFYEAKIHTARFYFDKVLPRTYGLIELMNMPSDLMMAIPAEEI